MNDMHNFPNRLPKSWFNEDFSPIEHKDDFQSIMKEWEDLFRTPQGRKLKADYRGKIFNFVETNGYIAQGRTNVDVVGTYIIGTPPAHNSDDRLLKIRTLGEQMYATAGVESFNATAKDTGWVHRDDENYSSREDALMAIEADSCGSKGPYDNATEDTALKTVSAVLTQSLGSKGLKADMIPILYQGLSRRYDEYSRYTTKSFTIKASDYVNHMQNRGLASTMRGFPFYAAGDSIVKDYQVMATHFMFRRTVPDIINLKDYKTIFSKMTVDQFIQHVLVQLQERKIPTEKWYSLDHAIIVPISRNQGSPFKTEWAKGKLVLTGERKDMKYRLVTPISAFVQARSILSVDDLVRNAKFTNGRVGLMDPATNTERMNKFIQSAYQRNRVIISTDFTGYDSTLNSQLMAAHCNMYTYLYTDEYVIDGMFTAALSLVNKIMLLPCYNSDAGQPYPQYERYFMRSIKGIKSYSEKQVDDNMIFKVQNGDGKVTKRFDYSVWAFYIYAAYLPSGHICTNMTGSDCTLMLSRFLVNALLHGEDCEANASGDDCIQEVMLQLFLSLGLQGIYEELQRCYDNFGMIVNAKKQIKILYKGLPLVDFLQHPYIQGEDSMVFQKTYNKFMRQFFSFPYTERRSRLGPVLQYNIVLGKGEAGSCEENVDFAAKIMYHYASTLVQLSKEKKFRPYVHPGLAHAKDKLTWNAAYAIDNSEYGGFEQLIGLVNKYGQDLISQLGKYAAGKLDDVVADFDKELETRAPHREGMAKAFYKAMGDAAYQRAGGDGRFGETVTTTHFYFIDVLKRWQEISGVIVDSVVLDQPLIGAEILQDGDAQADSENADNYEFDDSHVD